MSDVKRYVQTRNRDGDLVLTEDKGQNYLEWTKYILASDYDTLAAENARLRAELARIGDMTHHVAWTNERIVHEIRLAAKDALRGEGGGDSPSGTPPARPEAGILLRSSG